MNLSQVTQWQTARVVTAADTPLTDYRPAELTTAVKAKMFSVAPASGILLLPLAIGNDNHTNVIQLSGWMDPNKPHTSGPGIHLLTGCTITLGTSVWGTTDVPLADGKWVTGVYRFADTFTITANACGAVEFDASASNRRAMLLIPTLGFTHLLLEVSTLNSTKIGFLWRPISYGDVLVRNKAFS